jgi:SAM-dependent methyltransferase
MVRAEESYDRVAARYTEHVANELVNKPLDRELLRRFAVECWASEEHPICDLGCGPGHIARFLHDLGTPVVGIDLSTRMIEEARRLNPGIEFRKGDMRSLDVPAGRFSGVVAFYSIIHIPRDGVTEVLREIGRVLVPGGGVLIAFHVGDEVERLEEFFGQEVDLDFTFFGAEEMRGYLTAAGWSDIELVERDPYPEVEVQTRRAYVVARRPTPCARDRRW